MASLKLPILMDPMRLVKSLILALLVNPANCHVLVLLALLASLVGLGLDGIETLIEIRTQAIESTIHVGNRVRDLGGGQNVAEDIAHNLVLLVREGRVAALSVKTPSPKSFGGGGRTYAAYGQRCASAPPHSVSHTPYQTLQRCLVLKRWRTAHTTDAVIPSRTQTLGKVGQCGLCQSPSHRSKRATLALNCSNSLQRPRRFERHGRGTQKRDLPPKGKTLIGFPFSTAPLQLLTEECRLGHRKYWA